MRRATRLLATVSVAWGLVTGTCDKPVKAPPIPDRVALAGDSVLWQGYLYGGELRGADTSLVYPGTTALDFVDEATAMVANKTRSPEVLVIAFGQNNWQDYGSAEKSGLMQLAYAPADAACVVFLLPYNGIGAPNIDRYRADAVTLANARPHSTYVDWSIVVKDHPEYLASDHVHLNVPEYQSWLDAGAVPQPAAVAYLDVVWSGVAHC